MARFVSEAGRSEMGQPALFVYGEIWLPSLGVIVACFAEHEFEGDLTLAAEDADADRVAGLVFVHEGADVLGIGDLLTVDSDDEVTSEHDGRVADVGLLIAAVEASALGGSAGDDALDENAVVGGKSHLRGEVRTDGVRDDAERGTADAAVTSEIGEHGFGGVDGNGEADA